MAKPYLGVRLQFARSESKRSTPTTVMFGMPAMFGSLFDLFSTLYFVYNNNNIYIWIEWANKITEQYNQHLVT